MNVLALNAGSSTLKFRLLKMPGGEVLTEGVVEHAGPEAIVGSIEDVLAKCRSDGVDAVGYRIVHGGERFQQPTLLDNAAIDQLRQLRDIDPTHNPAQVALIEASMKVLPGVKHVAVFDTAFHATIPRVASTYAIPRSLTERLKLRRYGFHGLSHQYVSRALLDCLGRTPEGTRLITCHLGNGASVCAVKDGKSFDTSMGFTPLEGLVMGTRCGNVDPGLLIYLMRQQKMSVDDLDDLLNHKSGLLGLSGLTADVRALELDAEDEERAALALDVFAYRVRKYIGAYAAVLGGVDAVAFCGGIGEHSASVRARICTDLAFLGVALDDQANRRATGKSADRISVVSAAVPVWVIPTNEELEIARSVAAII